MSDIEPGWQAKVTALRETLRACTHQGERLHNVAGQLLCATCGLHLFKEQLYNALIEWVTNPAKTSEQPPGHVSTEFLALLDDFEAAARENR
jgi:hypothetical protein